MKQGMRKPLAVCLGLIVIGAVGNLIDSFVTYNDMDSKTLEYNLRARKGIYFLVANGKGGTIAKKVIIR